MKTVAVIVTYNRKAKLLACLKALVAQTVPCEILVVDNASTDGTGKAVADLWTRLSQSRHEGEKSSSTYEAVAEPRSARDSRACPVQHCARESRALRSLAKGFANASYLNTGANLGGAGGFAFGIRKAVEMGADRIWIMDDDVLPHPDALEKLLAADATLKSDYGWLSSKCLGHDGKICPMNLQRVTPYVKVSVDAIVPIASGREQADSSDAMETIASTRVQMASFVSLFFPAETVRRFGLPIADFFIWCDDLEWTRRVSRERPCYVVPASVVVHDIAGSGASDLATDTPARIDRYFYAFRNEFYTYRREGLLGLAYYFAKCAKNLLRVLLRARDNRLRRLSVLLHGVVKGLLFSPQENFR